MDLESLALQATGSEVAFLVLLAFVPPVIFVVWIRNTEKYGREPWSKIVGTFLWGAIFAVLIGAILETILILPFAVSGPLDQFIARRFGDPSTFALLLVALVIAPFVEEFTKAWGVLRRAFVIREPEDGFVYGATSGFGFSATENLMYGLITLFLPGGGFGASLLQIAIRSISSTLLHGSATSVTGYGIARHRLWGPRFSAFPWYIGAVAMHSAFNAIAVLGSILADPSQLGDAGLLIVLGAAVVFSVVSISVVRGKIMEQEGRQSWVP